MHHVNFSPRVTGHKHQALYIHTFIGKCTIMYEKAFHGLTEDSDRRQPFLSPCTLQTFIYIAFKRIVLKLDGGHSAIKPFMSLT